MNASERQKIKPDVAAGNDSQTHRAYLRTADVLGELGVSRGWWHRARKRYGDLDRWIESQAETEEK
jgi:hypothetical protein